MVFMFEGIFSDHPSGMGFLRPADDELAGVLAHEIAHVTLMHIAERETSALFTSRHEKDPYYRASYSTTDEAEADRLSVLYMALAGYDPMAAPKVWDEANRRYGSDPGVYLYDHPLNVERMRATGEAAAQVREYYEPGIQNRDWAMILNENPLFPRAATRTRQPGAGVAKAAEAALEAVERHQEAKDEAKLRERSAAQSPQVQATLVRLLETKLDDQGRLLIWMSFHNGARRDVSNLGVRVTYTRQQQPIAHDPNCGGPANIPAGQTVWLACAYQQVAGADSLNVEITSVAFR